MRCVVPCLLCLVAVLGCQPTETKTRKALLARLRDGRPAARIVALKELAHDPNQEETVAVANSARSATEDVRREIAATLGASKQPVAVDLLGALLRDPADSVRAAAVRALAAKPGERAQAYVVHAYESGGALTRMAVSEAPPATFRKAVEAEAAAWRERLASRSKDSRREIQAAARAESGREATPEVIQSLVNGLSAPDPVLAAAAAAGLVNAQAATAVPALIEALKSPSPLVVQAAAIALRQLGAQPALDALVVVLEKARDESALQILDAVEGLQLSDASRAALCRVATTHPDAPVSLRAARLVASDCSLPLTLPATSKEAAPRLLVLAELERKDAAVLRRARALLDDADAEVATAAAAYLSRCGEKADATALISRAQSQLAGLGRAKSARSARAAAQAAQQGPSPDQIAILQEFFGKTTDQDLSKAPPEITNKLSALIARRRSTADLGPVEDRPGAVGFLAAATAAAARLGGATGELVDSLLADTEPAIRSIAVEVAEVKPGDEKLLARLREDTDPRIRLRALLIELRERRPGVTEALAQQLAELEAEDRVAVARALSPTDPEARNLLLALLQGSDVAALVAAQSLGATPGAEVDDALRRAVERDGAANVHALVALSRRPGAAVDSVLLGAAVHPSPDLRAYAVQALADRRSCGAAAKLAPLAADFSGVVRAGVGRLQAACGAQ